MSSWKLVIRLKDSPSVCKVISSDVDVYLGRGDLGMEDSRYSRKQLRLRLEGNTGHAIVGRCGVNPAFIKDEEEDERKEEGWTKMEQGREYELHHGSLIKPLLIGPELVVDLQSDSPVAQPVLVKKAAKVVPCQYGAACYRLSNEEHCAKYSHPDVNEVNRTRDRAVLEAPSGVVSPAATKAPAMLAGQAALAREEAQEQEVSLETPTKKGSGGNYGGGWVDALWPMCQNPEKFTAEVLQFSERIVVIRDKFPKAKYHYLVLPRTKISRFKVRKIFSSCCSISRIVVIPRI